VVEVWAVGEDRFKITTPLQEEGHHALGLARQPANTGERYAKTHPFRFALVRQEV
jgi:glutamate synthase domain-containing protein 1